MKVLGKKLSYSSVKRNDSKKYEEKRNEIIANRLMFVFVLAVILITSLIIILNGNFFPGVLLHDVARFAAHIAAALAAASVIYFIAAKAKGWDEAEKTFSSGFLLTMALFSFSVFGVFGYAPYWGKYHSDLTTLLFPFIIAGALIYFTYYLYSREFFLLTAASAVACLCIYMCRLRAVFSLISLLAKAGLVAAPILIFICFFIIKTPPWFFKPFSVENKKSNKVPFLIFILLSLASAALMFFTTDFVFYNILALLAYYLVMGIIYTIKLI